MSDPDSEIPEIEFHLQGVVVRGRQQIYHWNGNHAEAKKEYSYFRRCLPQLMDGSSMTGDLSGLWVIFKNGWLADFVGFKDAKSAMAWADQLFRLEPQTSYIVAPVDLNMHNVSPLELLSDSIADVEFHDAE